MQRATLWKAALGLLVASTVAATAFAQGYPARQLEIVVPFSPGGSTDAMARIVAPRLSTELGGVPVVVVNKPGAGGAIGTSYVLAAADGSRIGTGGNSNLGPILAIGTSPGYQLSDVAGLARAVTNPMVLVAQKGKFETMRDFMAHASKDGVQVASWGPKSPGHFFIELLAQQGGAKLQHIPFEGGAKAVVGAMGGHVDAAVVTVTSALANIQAGKLTALAVTSPQRVEDLPNVPTLAELGLAGATYVSFDGFVAPAKMPADRLDTLRAAVARVLADPQVRADLKKTGSDPAFLSGRDYDGFLQNNVKVLAGIAAKAQIKE